VLDPAGQAVRGGLSQLGFSEVKEARIGKVIELELEDMPKDQAKARLEAMGKQLLANMVIEDFAVEIL
jgi:phosphoribosylformylglycinamidine synthase